MSNIDAINQARIVVTVGERIGKTHLTCAQGASAEIVAMATRGAAEDYTGCYGSFSKSASKPRDAAAQRSSTSSKPFASQ